MLLLNHFSRMKNPIVNNEHRMNHAAWYTFNYLVQQFGPQLPNKYNACNKIETIVIDWSFYISKSCKIYYFYTLSELKLTTSFWISHFERHLLIVYQLKERFKRQSRWPLTLELYILLWASSWPRSNLVTSASKLWDQIHINVSKAVKAVLFNE